MSAGKQTVSFTIFGGPELVAALDGVKEGVTNRVFKGVLGKLARRTAKTAKGMLRASRRTKALWRSIGVVYRSYSRNRAFAFIIGPRSGYRTVDQYGRPVDPIYYSHLVEGGRKEVHPTKKRVMAIKQAGVIFGTKVAAVPAAPFVAPAADQLRATAPGVLRSEIPAGIEREAARYASRGKTIFAR